MSVFVTKEDGTTLTQNFEKIFSEFNIQIKGKILIKPNFSARPPIIDGENTDPAFLKELIEFLIKSGAEKIFVAHGALLGTQDRHYPLDQMIENGGFSFLKSMTGVEIMDLDKEPKDLLRFEDFKFLLPKSLKDMDLHINLAKLKAHMETTVSLSIKNQMGLVAMGDRVNMHHTNLEKSLAYLSALIKPDLSIVDGIIAMEGNGPHHGQSKRLDFVVAGVDMVELDSTVCYLLGIDYKFVKHINFLEQLGVGKYPDENYLKNFDDYKRLDFVKAAKYEKFGNIKAWPTTACSRCITAINESGKLMKKHPFKYFKLIKNTFLSKKKYNVVIGNAEDLVTPEGEKIVCIGTCAKCFADKNNVKCLNKCPPNVQETIEWLEKEIK